MNNTYLGHTVKHYDETLNYIGENGNKKVIIIRYIFHTNLLPNNDEMCIIDRYDALERIFNFIKGPWKNTSGNGRVNTWINFKEMQKSFGYDVLPSFAKMYIVDVSNGILEPDEYTYIGLFPINSVEDLIMINELAIDE